MYACKHSTCHILHSKTPCSSEPQYNIQPIQCNTLILKQSPTHTFFPLTQAVGGTLIGIGSFLAVQEQEFDAIIEEDEIFYGPYILIASGCAIIIVAVIGMIGACCDYKLNRYLLFVVCEPAIQWQC